jgi:hypothetical protein
VNENMSLIKLKKTKNVSLRFTIEIKKGAYFHFSPRIPPLDKYLINLLHPSIKGCFSVSLSPFASMQPGDGTQRILQYNLIVLAILGWLISTSWAEDRLLDPSKLKMFVDELPVVPKILGFDVVSGVPKSKSLKIGMFKKKWVRTKTHAFFFLSTRVFVVC